MANQYWYKADKTGRVRVFCNCGTSAGDCGWTGSRKPLKNRLINEPAHKGRCPHCMGVVEMVIAATTTEWPQHALQLQRKDHIMAEPAPAVMTLRGFPHGSQTSLKAAMERQTMRKRFREDERSKDGDRFD